MGEMRLEISGFRKFLRWLIGLLVTATGFVYANNSYIVKDGYSDYVIIISEDSIASEKKAADELQYYIKEITGIELPIIKSDGNSKGKVIAVGFNDNLSNSLKPARYGSLNEEELIIDSDKYTLLLAGGRPRGTLYAVYEYLHSLGVRWYTPVYTKIPKCDDIVIPKIQYRYCPRVIGRKLNSGNNADNAWRAHNRLTCNTLWSPLGEEYGGFYAEGPDMHTFWRIIPESILKQHPDWLVETDGKRELPVGRDWGLCLSNPDARKYVIKRTIDYARKNSTKKVIWIGQNDGSQYCTCEKCQSFYDTHGGKPSSLIVQLVNELSDAIAQEMPDRMVKTLAYSWSLEPPENMTLRDNVIVMFCPMGDFAQPIATDPERENLRKALSGWKKIAKHMDTYLYFPFDDYWSPAPCTFSGAENIKWCADNGFNHFYTAISGSRGKFGSESVHLRSWVYARLMWNPNLDATELIDEFVRDYYGPASQTISKAIQLIHEDIYNRDGSSKKQNDSSLVPDYVNPKKVRKVNRLFENTYSKLPEGVYKKRFRFAWIPYLWADFWLGFDGLGSYDSKNSTWSVPMENASKRNLYGRMAKDFMVEHKVATLSELKTMDPTKLGIDKIGVDWPSCLLQDEVAKVVVIPGVGGRLFDFGNEKLDFLPFKEFYYANATRYPLYSTTQESVNGTTITEYDLLKQIRNKTILQANINNASVKKEITLQDGVLRSMLSLESKKAESFSLRNSMMLDLAPDAFGFHPKVYIEQKDSSWIAKIIGIETDFWWIEDDINLSNSTGRIVFKCEKNANGILLTVVPGQLKSLNYWYSRFEYKGVPPIEYCGMMRLFLNAPARNLNIGDSAMLSWSVQILPDITEVVQGSDL